MIRMLTLKFFQWLTKFGKGRLEKRASEKYINTNLLSPTSNLCDTIFSKADFGMSDRRVMISPENVESQMFLRHNRLMRGLSDVSQIVSSNSNE